LLALHAVHNKSHQSFFPRKNPQDGAVVAVRNFSNDEAICFEHCFTCKVMCTSVLMCFLNIYADDLFHKGVSGTPPAKCSILHVNFNLKRQFTCSREAVLIPDSLF
jgi:hypothetical protein